MKINNYIKVFIILAVLLPTGVKANVETIPNEARVLGSDRPAIERVRDLQNKLWKQEIEDRRSEFQRAREEFKNAEPEQRKIMREEFRAKFAERFKFTIDRLVLLQTKLEERINSQPENIDTAAAKAKLEESKSYISKINSEIESLKTLLAKDYTETERSLKIEEAKKLVESIKSNIKSSHQKLKEAFLELKNAVVENNESETNNE